MFTCLFIVSFAMCSSLVLESQAEPVSWEPINWGPMNVVGDIGNNSHKYWPLTYKDKQASHNGLYYAVEFHRFMESGLGEIPPLDPYLQKHAAPVHIHDHEVHGTIQLSNLLVVGAKNYKVAKLEVRLDTWRLDYVLEIPLLKNDFDLDANVKVDGLHNHLSAHVNVSVHNVVVKGAFTFKNWPEKADLVHQKLSIVATKYNVTSSNVQYNAQDVKAKSRRSQDSSSEWIKEIAQKIAQKQVHASALSVIKLLNKVLSQYTTVQILALLLPENSLNYENK